MTAESKYQAVEGSVSVNVTMFPDTWPTNLFSVTRVAIPINQRYKLTVGEYHSEHGTSFLINPDAVGPAHHVIRELARAGMP